LASFYSIILIVRWPEHRLVRIFVFLLKFIWQQIFLNLFLVNQAVVMWASVLTSLTVLPMFYKLAFLVIRLGKVFLMICRLVSSTGTESKKVLCWEHFFTVIFWHNFLVVILQEGWCNRLDCFRFLGTCFGIVVQLKLQ